VTTPKPPTVVDLFCGAGGFSLGFHAAGCEALAAVDFDEAAARTYRANFEVLQPRRPPVVLSGDEGNLEEIDLSHLASHAPDILIGGPPCQGFSRVGRGKLDSLSDEGYAGDARNSLYKRFLDAAVLWRPKAIVMENVPGMLSVDGRSVADEAASDLIALGYRTGYSVLNASWFGVPQFRERLFFVGIRKDLGVTPSLPATTHHVDLPSGYILPVKELFLPFEDVHHELDVNTTHAEAPATTARDALDDLPLITEHLDGSKPPHGDFRLHRRYPRRAHSPYARVMRSWPGLPTRSGIDDHVIRRTPRDYETFRRMKPGDRYIEARQIARHRFEAELARLARRRKAPAPGTPEYAELERSFVPPYPEDIFKDKWRKLIPTQPSWTIPAHLAKDAYSHIHYDDAQARAISVREAARLQSIPDGFRFAGNMGDCFRQIGNAVPPLLAWAIAAHVLDTLGLRRRVAPWQRGELKGVTDAPRMARTRVRRREAARR
jgi:DNA (cytosine-5)-methyltransferase 1